VGVRRFHPLTAPLAALAVPALGLAAAAVAAAPAAERFREANEAARAGDYPKALDAYHALAAAGHESAALYWNWAQAAARRGAPGEALWAVLRAREIEPGDAALGRELGRLREGLNLDAAELAPDPLAAVARFGRRFHLDLAGGALLAVSVLFHAASRLSLRGTRLAAAAWTAFALGVLLAAAPAVASLARPTAVVVRRAAPLLDAASQTAEPLGSLREGEVVLVLEQSRGYLRLEDSSGARGWASEQDVRRLDRAPAAPQPRGGGGAVNR
jgi:hypothetical protein